MANPIATSPSPSSEDGFDPTVFWIRHKTKIILYSGLLFVALAGYAIYEYTERRTQTQAAEALTQAETTEQLKAITDKYAGSPAAANALLRPRGSFPR